ncbi:MAG: HEAT repeat domain-containing protein [Algicola sp.]|nr:HEAT repeat domain-containing protein [Algicola sp.]
MKFTLKRIVVAVAALVAVSGCAPSSYHINNPSVSNIAYQQKSEQAFSPLTITDNRGNEMFSSGILPAQLKLGSAPLDPISFLTQNTVKELKSRGINMDFTPAGGIDVTVNKYRMRNYRSNGFSPFITFTMLSADVKTNDGTKRITAFIKRGKVPVWSFEEVIQPTMNEPMGILVKEFSAKLNALLYKHSISDQQVDKLINTVNNGGNYLDVYQLGFGNNKKAVDELKRLCRSSDEYIRLAAISSLGILGSLESFDFLKALYAKSSNWSDKAMTLKSIGDLDTPEGLQFMKDARKDFQKDKAKAWSDELLSLYL